MIHYNVLIPGLAVVRLPHHRHILTADCTVCRVRQESQDDKVIYVIDADNRRLLKSKPKDDFDEIGLPTWRNDENLKAWHYDDETNTWHESDEAPKPCEKKSPPPPKKEEKMPSHKNNGEVQLWRRNNGNIQESENHDMDDNSNISQVDRNNELQIYRPENDVSYIEGMTGNNELDYYSVDSVDAVYQ